MNLDFARFAREGLPVHVTVTVGNEPYLDSDGHISLVDRRTGDLRAALVGGAEVTVHLPINRPALPDADRRAYSAQPLPQLRLVRSHNAELVRRARRDPRGGDAS